MKVRELRELLDAFDQDAEVLVDVNAVYVEDRDRDMFEITDIDGSNDDVILLVE